MYTDEDHIVECFKSARDEEIGHILRANGTYAGNAEEAVIILPWTNYTGLVDLKKELWNRTKFIPRPVLEFLNKIGRILRWEHKIDSDHFPVGPERYPEMDDSVQKSGDVA